MKASVIVSEKNSEDTIIRCLESLLNQTYKNYEIVVVDSYSTDGTYRILDTYKSVDKFKNKIMVIQTECSEAKGQNIGASISNGDIILFTNSDKVFPNNWIEQHLSYYPEFDLINGYPAVDLHGLAFANVSMKRNVYEILKIRELKSQQDLDFAYRLMRFHPEIKTNTIRDIRVEDIGKNTLGKVFWSAYNHGIMRAKYKIFFRWEDIKYLKKPYYPQLTGNLTAAFVVIYNYIKKAFGINVDWDNYIVNAH